MANYRGTWTLFMRETRRFMRVYMQTLLAPVISNLLYLAIFGISIQRSFSIEGLSYLQFLVPGLIMMGIINNAYQNTSSSLTIMKYQGLITDLASIPLKKIEILIAMASSATLRGLLVGIVTLITASFFVSFPYTSIFVILLSSILVALFFAFAGMIVGIWADEFDRQAFIANFILMPLIFLGGVFYPVSQLPGIFAKISSFNPIVYMIDLLRYGFTGVHEYSLLLGFSVISTFTLIAGLAAFFMLKSGYKIQS